MEIIDISDSTHPIHTGKILNGANGALLSTITNVYATGNYAYVISQSANSLETIDVSDPTNPRHMT
ncbi:MAG: hypothetical protein WCP92_08920 [bacterium]